MRPQIHEIVDESINKVRDTGVMDIVVDLSCPLPVIVIARMLGVPAEDSSKLGQWSNEMSRIIDPLMSLEDYDQLNQVAVEFTDYFRDLIVERRKTPKEDLISALIAARDQGDKLSEDELLSVCMVLFVTGEETTVHTIGNGMLALLRHPDQMELLRRNPIIIQSAVEEILRYDSPVQQTARIAMEDVEIGGKTIRAGENVLVSFGAANRDPAQFSKPDQLNLIRDENHHLAFGDSIHYCLGAALARLQGQIAINTLMQRLPDLKLNTDKLEWRKNINIRGLKSLPVSFTP
jgi:cytochrome P450